MSPGIAALSGVALLVSASSMLLKNLGSRASPIIASIGIVGLISLAASGIGGLLSDLSSVVEASGISLYAEAVMKIIAVSFLASGVSDVCSELGETGVGRALITASKIEIAVIAMPFFKELIEIGKELFGG